MSARTFLTLGVCLVALSANAETFRRIALIAGNDEGGEGTRPLLYAKDDARKVHGILTRLGNVRPEDARLLLDADAGAFVKALGEAEREVAAARARGEKTALIVYYSGHAKDGALRLGDSQLPFAALKKRLTQAGADVRIGIFDACRSGELTRTKGARRAPSFDIQSDSGRAAAGWVVLTSSAADEDSQESDQLGGSYFTHHLASGLLGDADRSADGRVSLAEAYAYAYDRTVADTAASAAGAQHPTFSYDLAGNGDILLTDLQSRSEGVLFPAGAPAGVYYLVDGRGFVAAEVRKPEGLERRLALAPGSYRVQRRLSDRLRVGEVSVASGRISSISEASMRDAPFSDDPVKGPGLRVPVRTHWSFGIAPAYRGFLEGSRDAALFPSSMLLGVEANLHDYLRQGWVWSFDLALGGGKGVLPLSSAELAYDASAFALGSTLAAEWPGGRLVPSVGLRLALLGMTRTFADPAFPKQTFSTFSPGLVGALRWHFTPSFSVGSRARLHYLLYDIDETRSLASWELAVTVGYAL